MTTSAIGHDTAEILGRHNPQRWGMSRAGLLNVWHYHDATFNCSGGRLVLRGTNGSGKSRALEMLLPYLLDADRRKMDATGSGKVRLQDLMKAGSTPGGSREGYLWLELVRETTTGDAADDGVHVEHLTLGAFIRFSQSTGDAKVWYFTTPLRVGHDLQLMSSTREVLSRDQLTSLIGADRITDSPEVHRERVRNTVYGLTGESGRDRFVGLMQLTHTLRSPDVGNRIEEGRLPQILSDALPPLGEAALNAAGEQLDGLSETRAGQERLESAYRHVNTFFGTYRKYAAKVLAGAATAADESAIAAQQALHHADQRHSKHLNMVEVKRKVERTVAELVDAEGHLEATITGIKSSASYAHARDLDERERKIAALARSSDSAFSAAAAARRNEISRVRDASTRAVAAEQAAKEAGRELAEAHAQLGSAGVPANFAGTASVHAVHAVTAMDTVRTIRKAGPEPVDRPAAAVLCVTPADISGEQARIGLTIKAADMRQRQAGARLDQARQLEKEKSKVAAADQRAEEDQDRADKAAAEATEAADHLRSELTALSDQWRGWVSAPETTEALGSVDFGHDPIKAFLQNPDSVLTDPNSLGKLDRAATIKGTAARQRHDSALFSLDNADKTDVLQRAGLDDEKSKLQAAIDQPPAGPSWLGTGPEGSVPLWRAVDFSDGIPDADRSGIEGALLASGLLLGSVIGDGSLLATDGQLLLQGTGHSADSPLRRVLSVDPATPNPDAVISVLERIGYGSGSHGTWVAPDGTWGNGPLTGRHVPGPARHIGAAARAAARAARLALIAAELETLDAALKERSKERAGIARALAQLEGVLEAAPRSQPIATAVALDDAAEGRFRSACDTAATAKKLAQDLRRKWDTAQAEHRNACVAFGLPVEVGALSQIQRDAGEAAKLCTSAAKSLQRLDAALAGHAGVLGEVQTLVDDRERAETQADLEWRTWHSEEAEFAAVRAAVGAEAAIVREKLDKAENDLAETRSDLIKERKNLFDLLDQIGQIRAEAASAREKADAAQKHLEASATGLQRMMALPGVADAALPPAFEPISLTDFTVKSVRGAAGAVSAALRGKPTADENALIKAQQALEREIVGTYDVLAEIKNGVRLIEVSDASGRRTIAAAATELARQRDEGKAALSDREHRVFSDFVLGGVADELRRRLDQASALMSAMNDSLSSIRTSHGIGVKVRWVLAEGAGASVTRIRDLVTTAPALRTTAANGELAELLKARVGESFAANAASGYAEHLRSALDYRAWHTVEVIITGPGEGQQRRLTRGAKLSQGETRFVSYVTLFAAVDAYLSSLPGNGGALRLLLLDDAFAKVDDQTIAELMGLLVRLDIDFAMTGHDLWGTYAQVPALDCYEIRRRQDGPAVTTHLHWDGRNRHLRAAQ
ncbi:TIGR02680 family protein [Paenarthrobacter nitroguajacolicus]|uniref:TIGR02680 family protein n=1 Tax=Paenarthrobacter nitroguajacolicus TaxID=211146 RepID=UPI003D1D7FD5